MLLGMLTPRFALQQRHYDPEAAKLAWTRTLEFFNKHVR